MTTTNSSHSKNEEDLAPWNDDALNRKQYAEFLTSYLGQRTKGATAEERRPFCMALDARWGEGKTYFIKNWQMQLRRETLSPSFIFDAWAADYQADPIIAFIAAFKESLDLEIAKLPKTDRIQARAKKAVQDGLKQFRSAVIPVGKAVLKGAINKATAGAFSEVTEALKDGSLEISELDFETVEGDAMKGLRDGLDKYFAQSLHAQASRETLFQTFRNSIAEAIDLLEKKGGRTLPFYVFVDEIDRCRPTFAVELLECLKHIFSIRGLCFVVSTNMEQLSHAVSAVYGAGFNGRGYLQRFFGSLTQSIHFQSRLHVAMQLGC